MNKILIIAAHPDDDILGCGGFIAKYSEKKLIKIVFVAEGTTARYPAAEITSDNAIADISKRSDYALKALHSLGIADVTFHDKPCGRLDQVPILDLNKIIESEIDSFGPDTVFTHSEFDTNNDHRIVHRSTYMATRPGGLHYVPNLLSFEIQSSSEWNYCSPFCPNHFEVLTGDHVASKWRALAHYESEIRDYPHPRSQEGVETLARYRGMQAGVPFAEAFKVIRRISK